MMMVREVREGAGKKRWEGGREGGRDGGREGGRKGGQATYVGVEGGIDVIPPRLNGIKGEKTMEKVEGSGEGEIDALGGKREIGGEEEWEEGWDQNNMRDGRLNDKNVLRQRDACQVLVKGGWEGGRVERGVST